jgi:hypothetical protein
MALLCMCMLGFMCMYVYGRGGLVQEPLNVTATVRWTLEGSGRSGVLHILHLPLSSGTHPDHVRSDAGVATGTRRGSAAVISVRL